MISIFIIGMAVLLGSVVTIVTTALVNALFLRNEIKNRYKEAAKAIIKSKDVNVVYVDVYNQDNKKIQELEIKSETGIDNSISEGQTYKIQFL